MDFLRFLGCPKLKISFEFLVVAAARNKSKPNPQLNPIRESLKVSLESPQDVLLWGTCPGALQGPGEVQVPVLPASTLPCPPEPRATLWRVRAAVMANNKATEGQNLGSLRAQSCSSPLPWGTSAPAFGVGALGEGAGGREG